MRAIRRVILFLACASAAAKTPARVESQLLALEPLTGEVLWRYAIEGMWSVEMEFYPEGALLRPFMVDPADRRPPVHVDPRTGKAIEPFRTDPARRNGGTRSELSAYRANRTVHAGEWVLWSNRLKEGRLIFAPPGAERRDRRTGLPKVIAWSIRLPESPSDVRVADGKVYLAVGTRLLAYAIGAAEPAWTRELSPPVRDAHISFQVLSGRLFAQAGRRVFEIESGTGRTLFERDLEATLGPGGIFGWSPGVSFALAGEDVLVVAAEERVAAFSLSRGEVLWQFEPRRDGRGMPLARGNILYVLAGRKAADPAREPSSVRATK